MLYGRDPPRGLRDYEIPEVLHDAIHTVEELGSSYTVGTIRGTLDRKYRRGEIELGKVHHTYPSMRFRKQKLSYVQPLNSFLIIVYYINVNVEDVVLSNTVLAE